MRIYGAILGDDTILDSIHVYLYMSISYGPLSVLPDISVSYSNLPPPPNLDASHCIYPPPIAKKRVLFVGYNHAAKDVCRAVLSAVAMVAPIPNIIHRTHPYANLTDLSFLDTPGYIAGVTNPMFLERDAWWVYTRSTCSTL